MSIYLVVARARDQVTAGRDPAAAGLQDLPYATASDLALALGDEADRSIAYAAREEAAVNLVREAVTSDAAPSVVIVPIADSSATTSVRLASEPNDLRNRLGPLLAELPEAEVAIARPSGDRTPSIAELIGALGSATQSDERLLDAAIGRAFDGDTTRFGRFVAALQKGMPPGTSLALRGSAVAGRAYRSGEPFDAGGRHSSDLDIVLLGEAAMEAWDPAAFFLPGVNTMPLADESPWFAPTLEPARAAAQAIAGRPVSLQAMARWFLDLRAALQGQPYVLLDA